jgi:hypothetical protein
MKILLWNLILVAVVLVAAATWVRAQPQSDRPPGVAAERWISISDNAGVMLLEVPSQLPQGFPSILPPEVAQRFAERFTPKAPGLLMVKVGGKWTQVDVPLPPPRFEQLH